MKLGFVSAILDGWTFEETVEIAAQMGYRCVEVACWPAGKAERRYAGVSHIDVDALDDAQVAHIQQVCRDKGVQISALAYYPNPLDGDAARRAAVIAHLQKVIRASHRLGVNLVTTFLGRNQGLSVEDNLTLAGQVWPPLLRLAEELGVKIAIENCPMLFDRDQWPGGQNLMTTPAIWEKVFAMLPSPNLGLNFDPSHFVWQQMDYLRPLYDFREKLFHVHFKDIKLYPERLARVGVMAYPLEYMSPKLPGLGDVNWGRYVSALTDVGYDGFACIEVEDRAFEGSRDKVLQSLLLSHRYMAQFVL